MKGATSKPVFSSPSARMSAAPGASVRTFLKLGELADLERHQPELLLDRNLVADHGGGEHLAHGVVGVDLGGVLGHLHGDVAGEGGARQDHRIAPHVGGAILGAFDGVVGEPCRGLDALRLDAAGAAGIGLEGIDDLAIGLGGQVGDQDLDALILGLEAGEGLGLVEADQRRHADPGARRKDRVCGERRRCQCQRRGRPQLGIEVSFMKDLLGLH